MWKQVIILFAFVAAAACGPHAGPPAYAPDENTMRYPSQVVVDPYPGEEGADNWAEGPYRAAQGYQVDQASMIEQQQAKGNGSLSGHLRELARSVKQGSVQAYTEAKPVALEGIKKVRGHPRLIKGLQAAKPHIEAIRRHTEPVVNRGTKLIGNLTSRAQQHLQQRQQRQQARRQQGSLTPAGSQGVPHDVEAAGLYGPAPPAYDDVYRARAAQY